MGRVYIEGPKTEGSSVYQLMANKLSLKEGKPKFTLFHKPRDEDNLPLLLPNLKLNNNEIKRSSSIKFRGVLVDENLTWIDHITLV